MATIYLHAMVKELAGRSTVECPIVEPSALGDVLRANLSERELFLIVDETGAVREHLNIFIDARKIRDLAYAVGDGATVDIFPAVSGG